MKRVGFLVCCLALTACGGGGSGSQASSVPSGSSPTVVANTPDINTFPGLSWNTVAPADVGMTQAGIDLALDYAFRSAHNTQGVVIIRHGVIVGERYAEGKTQQSLATSWSTGKSFASALIGIAVEQGFIESIDVPAESYLAPWVNTDKADISIRAILEMRTGLQVAENGDAAIYNLAV
jgi:CubicO group peptidase (beta-lactamase class C family)